MAASTVRIETFRAGTASQIADAMNTYFAANPSLLLVDWSFWKHLDRNYQAVRLMLQDGAGSMGVRLRALGVDSVGSEAAQTALAAFVAANPEYLPIAHKVLTLRQSTSAGGNISMLWLFIDGSASFFAGSRTGVFIAEPTAPIAAGATGDAQIYTADGGLGDIRTIRNVSGAVWAAGERNYVVPDITTLELIGIPTGCGIATGTLATITSPYCVPPATGVMALDSVNVTNITNSGFRVRPAWTMASDTYGVVVPTGSAVPTSDSIFDQTVPGALAYDDDLGKFAWPAQRAVLIFTGLASATTYDVYYFAQAASGGGANRSAVYKETVTTL